MNECERPDADRRRQWSSLVCPDGSVVCVSHMAPVELAAWDVEMAA